MVDVVVKIPKDLESEFEGVDPVFWQLAVNRTLNKELDRLKKLKAIVSRSKLSDEDVDDLSSKINESLAERYRKQYCKQ